MQSATNRITLHCTSHVARNKEREEGKAGREEKEEEKKKKTRTWSSYVQYRAVPCRIRPHCWRLYALRDRQEQVRRSTVEKAKGTHRQHQTGREKWKIKLTQFYSSSSFPPFAITNPINKRKKRKEKEKKRTVEGREKQSAMSQIQMTTPTTTL